MSEAPSILFWPVTTSGVLCIGKVAGVTNAGWWVVTAPMWIPFGTAIIVGIPLGIIAAMRIRKTTNSDSATGIIQSALRIRN